MLLHETVVLLADNCRGGPGGAVPDSEMIGKSETWQFGHLGLVGMAVEKSRSSGIT